MYVYQGYVPIMRAMFLFCPNTQHEAVLNIYILCTNNKYVYNDYPHRMLICLKTTSQIIMKFPLAFENTQLNMFQKCPFHPF